MNTLKFQTIELHKGDWVRLKPDIFVNNVYGNVMLLSSMVFPGIKQIEEVKSRSSLTVYIIGSYYYSAEMLEYVARNSYNNPCLQSAMEEVWEGFKSYNPAIASKEKDAESSSLNLVVNKNKKKIHLNFKQ